MLTAKAYGLTTQEVGVCSCSSEAFNLLSLALGLQEGDEVVINDLDFPAAATPWSQPSCPATVKLWRSSDGALRVEDLAPLLGPRTRLVALSLVRFYNGYRVSLSAVIETIRRLSPALLSADVTQALGRIPLDLTGVDFIVSSTHKWILASHGGGLVGVPAARAAELTARAGGWFHLENAFDSDRFERAVTKPGAASYSVGMPNYPAAYAVRAGLEYIDRVGVASIDGFARPLVRACIEGVRRLSVDLLTPVDEESLAGIVAFRHPKADRIQAYLRERHIHIMAHAGRIRASIHCYNTLADIERFLDALGKALGSV